MPARTGRESGSRSARRSRPRSRSEPHSGAIRKQHPCSLPDLRRRRASRAPLARSISIGMPMRDPTRVRRRQPTRLGPVSMFAPTRGTYEGLRAGRGDDLGEVSVTAGGREPPRNPHPPHGLWAATESSEARHRGVAVADDDDWAITPVVLPQEPMVLMSASWEQSRPQPSVAPRREEEPPPSVLTVDELATLLRVNRKTVYDALSRGEI